MYSDYRLNHGADPRSLFHPFFSQDRYMCPHTCFTAPQVLKDRPRSFGNGGIFIVLCLTYNMTGIPIVVSECEYYEIKVFHWRWV